MYESRIAVPQWLSFSQQAGYRWNAEAARNADWWLGAATAALIDRVMTFSYFIPTMIRLMRSDPAGGSEAAAKALRWVRLGYVRHAATLGAWLAALIAFYLMGQHGG